MGQFVTIRRWALKDGASENELVAHVRDRLIPAYREQPGCLELELLRTSEPAPTSRSRTGITARRSMRGPGLGANVAEALRPDARALARDDGIPGGVGRRRDRIELTAHQLDISGAPIS